MDLPTGSAVPEAERDELGKELNWHIKIEKKNPLQMQTCQRDSALYRIL